MFNFFDFRFKGITLIAIASWLIAAIIIPNMVSFFQLGTGLEASTLDIFRLGVSKVAMIIIGGSIGYILNIEFHNTTERIKNILIRIENTTNIDVLKLEYELLSSAMITRSIYVGTGMLAMALAG
jgi:hypothetical protein